MPAVGRFWPSDDDDDDDGDNLDYIVEESDDGDNDVGDDDECLSLVKG